MTEDTMNLRGLLEKTADSDFLREMIGFSAQRLMELEVESLTGAPHGARNPDRLTHRNGYRERDWETRAGTVELRIPKLPAGPRSSAPGCPATDRRCPDEPERTVRQVFADEAPRLPHPPRPASSAPASPDSPATAAPA